MTDRARAPLGVGMSLAMALGCSAGAPPWPSPSGSEGGVGSSALGPSPDAAAGAMPGSGGGGTPGAGAGGAASTNERPPGVGLDTSLVDSGAPLAAGACEQALSVAAQPPTVIVVADRSGSMFNPAGVAGLTIWSELRSTVLSLILALEDEARFGFTAYSGDEEVCPELSSLPPGLGQHAAIAALYGSLDEPQRRNGGPLEALSAAEAALSTAAGQRHVWLVSDGDVDYCDDGNPLCPVDSTIARLQRLAGATPSIRTTVFGPAATTSILASSALQAFANAGAAQPVAPPALGAQAADPNAIFDQCSLVPDWAADFAGTGKPAVRGQSVGDYAASGGSALVRPPGSDLAALVSELRSGLIAERPCAFDLAASGASADALASLDGGAVLELDGTRVPQDDQNGWRLVGASTLRLEGESCTALRAATEARALTLRWICPP